MDLKQFRYFVAVYEEGSLSRAAVREHCTQPGLSVHIQQMENLVGQKLFDRSARGVTPTIAGQVFYGSCMKVLRSVREARQQMLDFAGQVSGNINVGLPPSFSRGPLPEVLKRFLADHPCVNVRLAEAYSGTLSAWAADGDVDIAIVTAPPAHLGLDSTRFYRDPLVLVRREEGGPRRQRKVWAADDLRKLKLVIPSPRHSLRKAIGYGIGSPEDGQPRIVEIDGLVSTIEFVRNSDWATILPAIAVTDDVRHGRLLAEPIVNPALWLDYYLIRPKDRPLSIATQRFLQSLKAVLEKSSQDRAYIAATEASETAKPRIARNRSQLTRRRRK